jgi:PhnB protein
MARTTTYLHFMGTTEEAFQFYQQAFGTEIIGEIVRMGSVPMPPDAPPMSDADKNAVMHVALPILGGHVLMGTDSLESMGHSVTFGTNVSINLEPDTREETERLFAALSAGGKVDMPLTDMPWGGYFANITDRFGVMWMFNGPGPSK